MLLTSAFFSEMLKKKPQNYWKLFQAEEKNQIQSRDGRTNLFLTSVAQQRYTYI